MRNDGVYECPHTGAEIVYDIKHRRTLVQFMDMDLIISSKKARSILISAIKKNPHEVRRPNFVMEAMIIHIVTTWIEAPSPSWLDWEVFTSDSEGQGAPINCG